MTLEQIAVRLNISTTTVHMMERGVAPNALEKYLPELIRLYGLRPEVLDAAHLRKQGELRGRMAQDLGARAAARRELLQISRAALAAKLGVAYKTLAQAEVRLPDKIREYESAWEDALLVPRGWLRDAGITAVSSKAYPDVPADIDRTAANDIRDACCWYARSSPLFRTVSYASLDVGEQRIADIMMQRFGMLGEDVSVLEAVGERHHITRERVRQIEEQFLSVLDHQPLVTPGIDRLLAECGPALPMPVKELEVRFASRLGETQSVIGVDRFMRTVLGKSGIYIAPPEVPSRPYYCVMPLNMPAEDVVKTARQVALREIRVIGAAQIQLVSGVASSEIGHEVSVETVVKACRSYPGFEWLIEEDGWFWFGHENARRLRGTLMKMFSVTTRPLDIEEIHQGITRARLVKYGDNEKRARRIVEVPMLVLQEAVARFPGVAAYQYDDFHHNDPLAPEEHLAESEYAIYKAIMGHGGVICRQDLLAALNTTAETVRSAIAMTLERSPIFLRLEPGIWAIRGVRFTGEAYDMAIAHWQSGKRMMAEARADADGWRSFEFVLPPGVMKQSNWLLPTVVVRNLRPGVYAVEETEDTVEFRCWPNTHGAFLRYRHIFARFGLGPGVALRLSVHEDHRKVRIEKLSSVNDLVDAAASDTK
jgi:DNA-binding XRE family transcriptional regulator